MTLTHSQPALHPTSPVEIVDRPALQGDAEIWVSSYASGITSSDTLSRDPRW